ncbi:hypothetical protein M8009_10375 [Halomonas sp. ATCH28]|uniref:Uncharacterized protein n=1 Tax=Halomonas gemina TaxID=2945105 RepID=A0ABT0T1B1_9GAMM|nr:hypothetical protein [Halomonas gemina]MCL7940695.1 hypothetical protein [Halomonas gemina]
MSRQKGSRNRKPSKQAIASYYKLLAHKADEGDTYAAAKLVELDLFEKTVIKNMPEKTPQ